MKNRKYNYTAITLITALFLAFTLSCEREFDNLTPADFPSNGDVFIDGFSAGLAYEAYGDVTAFDVDNDVRYKGEASMRFAVPDEGETGGFAGGRFITSTPRDLSGYDALTFWAKATKAASIDVIGFGDNNDGSKFRASLNGVKVNTNWKKIIIPIPDATKLKKESGMLYYAEAPEEGSGYTFWIDEVKFEKLGTIAHAQPTIFGGEDESSASFNSVSIPIVGLGFIANLPNGVNQSVDVAPSYFTFSSSEESVASVDDQGSVTLLSEGTSVITAKLGDEDAEGSLTVESSGEFINAPTPVIGADSVISVFSNHYENAPVDYYNGYWQPFQTTLSADFSVGEDDVLNYTNFNFVGIQFTGPTIDASDMTHLHLDIFIPKEVAPSDKLQIRVVDLGPDGGFGDPDPVVSFDLEGAAMASNSWISVDIDLSSLASKTKLAQIVFDNLGSTLTNFYADNIYFYNAGESAGDNEPTEAAPEPADDESNVISIYSDSYTNLEGTDYPDWGQTTQVSDVALDGNNALKFSGFNYQGIQLANNLDASEMEFLHLDYWTTNSTALNVYLISAGGVETPYALTVPTTGWSSVDIPLSAFSPVELADIIQLKFDGNGVIFLDNIYFRKEGGTVASSPTAAAPAPPSRDAANVISIFSDTYTDVPVSNIDPDWGQSTDATIVDIAGNSTLSYANFNYQGMELDGSQDISGMEYLHVDMWTADATVVEMTPINASGSPTENLVSLTPISAGQWNSYDIPLSEFTGTGMSINEIIQLKFDGTKGTTPSNIWLDNIYFYKESGGGGTTSEYCETVVTHFGIAAETASAVKLTIANLDEQSMKVTVESADSDPVDVLVVNNLNGPITGSPAVSAVDDSEAGKLSVTLTWAETPPTDVELNVLWSKVSNPGNWQLSETNISVPFNATCSGSGGGGGTIDTEPTAAAPAPPSRDAANVISIFSDAYTDVPLSNIDPDWGQSTDATIVDIAGNSTLSYANFNYQGMELDGSQDISGMEYLHVDMWTADATVVEMTPINASGSPTENLVSLTPITAGQWNSYDIPLSEFTSSGMSLNEIVQLKFDGQKGTTPSNIWLDNIYFYKEGDGGGTVASAFPIDFEDGSVLSGAFDGGANGANVENPDKSGINTSSKVYQFNKVVNSAWYSGMYNIFDQNIDLTKGTTFTLKIWSPTAGINVRFQLEKEGGDGDPVTYQVDQAVSQANTWEELTFDFSSVVNTADGYDKIVIFPDYDESNQNPVSTEATYYIDDITQQ